MPQVAETGGFPAAATPGLPRAKQRHLPAGLSVQRPIFSAAVPVCSIPRCQRAMRLTCHKHAQPSVSRALYHTRPGNANTLCLRRQPPVHAPSKKRLRAATEMSRRRRETASYSAPTSACCGFCHDRVIQRLTRAIRSVRVAQFHRQVIASPAFSRQWRRHAPIPSDSIPRFALADCSFQKKLYSRNPRMRSRSFLRSDFSRFAGRSGAVSSRSTMLCVSSTLATRTCSA